MYINKQTGMYPYTEQTIKKLYPNISFGTPFEAPDEFAKVVEVTSPITADPLKMVIEKQPTLSNGIYSQSYEIVDRFVATEDKTKAELEAEYMAKKTQELAKAMENAIENHINTTVKARGYNSQDSIAKYLVSGNPFYAECTAISLWIGSVWVYSHQVQADVLAGTRTMPTIEELIAELPELVVV